MRVEFVCALADEQWVQPLELAPGATVADALACLQWPAKWHATFPQPDWTQAKLGIFGERCSLDHTLREGDRLELYRELHMDAQSARKRRSAQQARSASVTPSSRA